MLESLSNPEDQDIYHPRTAKVISVLLAVLGTAAMMTVLSGTSFVAPQLCFVAFSIATVAIAFVPRARLGRLAETTGKALQAHLAAGIAAATSFMTSFRLCSMDIYNFDHAIHDNLVSLAMGAIAAGMVALLFRVWPIRSWPGQKVTC